MCISQSISQISAVITMLTQTITIHMYQTTDEKIFANAAVQSEEETLQELPPVPSLHEQPPFISTATPPCIT